MDLSKSEVAAQLVPVEAVGSIGAPVAVVRIEDVEDEGP